MPPEREALEIGSQRPESRSRELTRADFAGCIAQVLQSGRSRAPDVLLYTINGEQVVLKDFSGKAWLWRNLLGRLLTAREARVLRALTGLPGVPQYRGRPDAWSVAMTFVPNRQASRPDSDARDDENYVRELEELVAQLHACGVVHLDLKHRSNLGVSPEGHPVVLDFASGHRFNPRSIAGRLALKLLIPADRAALLKWRCKFRRDTVGDDQAAKLNRIRAFSRWLHPVKALRRLFRKRRRR